MCAVSALLRKGQHQPSAVALHCQSGRCPARQIHVAGPPQRKQHQLRTQFAAAAISSGSDPSGMDVPNAAVSQLKERIWAAELELQKLFEPGRMMPKASTVAAARKGVAELKSELATALSRAGLLPSSAGMAGPATGAKLAIEVDRSLQQQAISSRSAADDPLEVALLEFDTRRLRREATALLLRQAQLEEVSQKAGVLSRPS